MARYMYVGPEIATEIFGIVFPRGQAVEVTNEAASAKLATHPLFAADGDAPKAKKTEAKK